MTEKRNFLIYGDSNTYGYDPADLYERRYPAKDRWTTILQGLTDDSWNIIPEGMNGRKLPDLMYDHDRLLRMLKQLRTEDIFAVMLGTNDILLTMDPDAETAVRKMDAFLAFLIADARIRPGHILVIAPPHIGNKQIKDALFRRYYEESIRMNGRFRELTARHGTMFLDAAGWDIELAYDHVHFSEKGHARFAAKMGQFLMGLV